MPAARSLVLSLVAILGISSCRTFAASQPQIKQSISSAIKASSLDDYTKKGCLASLQLWAEEKKPPKFDAGAADGALFFLGDSYLAYNFAFIGVQRGRPTLIRHVAEGSDHAQLTEEQLMQLTSLVSSSKRDKPPSQKSQALHQTCSVFYTPSDGYFVVQPDELQASERSTDAAIRLMSQISPDAP